MPSKELTDSVVKPSSLSIICPCFNESEGLPELYRRLKAVVALMPTIDCRIVLIDDGSSDDSLQILNEIAAKDESVLVYSFSRNFGKEIAILAGMEVANTDAVILLDSDLQHPPTLIPIMVKKWLEGSDVVVGVRTENAGQSWIGNLMSDAFYFLINLVSEHPMIPRVSDFYLLSARAKRALTSDPQRRRFLRGGLSSIGYSLAEVPFEVPPREFGGTKFNYPQRFKFAFNAFLSHSGTPIRLMLRGGGMTAVAGMLFGMAALVLGLLKGGVSTGLLSLSIQVTAAGAQCFFLGLVAEFIQRTSAQSSGRPLYFFKQEPKERGLENNVASISERRQRSLKRRGSR